jgi:hypothetical protein
MPFDKYMSRVTLLRLSRTLREEFSRENLLELCQELQVDCERYGFSTDITLGIIFLVDTLYDQQRIPDLLAACNRIQPNFSDKFEQPISVEWTPKISLSREIIKLTDWILGFSGKPYSIDEGPFSSLNPQLIARATGCYCWPFESVNRGAYDISESEPLWRLLFQVRRGLGFQDKPAFAYIGAKRTWGQHGMGYTPCIVIAPSSDQFDSLRIEEIADGNCGLDTEDWIREIKSLDEQFGVDIIAVYDLSLTIQLKRLPSEAERRELNRWFRIFATKAFEQYGELQLENLKQPFDVWCDD